MRSLFALLFFVLAGCVADLQPTEDRLKFPDQFGRLKRPTQFQQPSEGAVQPAQEQLAEQSRPLPAEKQTPLVACSGRCDREYEAQNNRCQDAPPIDRVRCHTIARGDQGTCMNVCRGGGSEPR